jgi:hypothetical protein
MLLTFAVMNMIVVVAVDVAQMRSGLAAYREVLKVMAETSWRLRRRGHETYDT